MLFFKRLVPRAGLTNDVGHSPAVPRRELARARRLGSSVLDVSGSDRNFYQESSLPGGYKDSVAGALIALPGGRRLYGNKTSSEIDPGELFDRPVRTGCQKAGGLSRDSSREQAGMGARQRCTRLRCVLRHVAFWNRYLADCLNGKQANDSLNELPVVEYRTKAKVLGALLRSWQDVVGALRARAPRRIVTPWISL